MKLLIKSLIVLVSVTLSSNLFAAPRDLKEGDKVYLKCTGTTNQGYLSLWGNGWVVIDPTNRPNEKQTWTIKDLSRESNGSIKFRLWNHASKSYMDGDQDNSVVLDDNDHTWWTAGSMIQVDNPNDYGTVIYNVDWSGEFYLNDRGDTDNSKDVVLRKGGVGIRAAAQALKSGNNPFLRSGNYIKFIFESAR